MKTTAVLYVNGLGAGEVKQFEKIVQRHWLKANVDFEFARINWYDGESLEDTLGQVDELLTKLLQSHERVILLGSSAGGSLALNTFVGHPSDRLYLVNAHGRLRAGNIHWPDYRTLEWAAHLQSNPKLSSQAFYDSVLLCEHESLPQLTSVVKKRILVLKPPLDLVVPVRTMNISGVKTHTTILPGHAGAGISHLFFCRDYILHFATMAA